MPDTYTSEILDPALVEISLIRELSETVKQSKEQLTKSSGDDKHKGISDIKAMNGGL